MLDAHTPVPLVELLEQVRIDLEKIERRRIGQRRRFHETQEQEEIVEFGRLLTQLKLVAAKGDAVHELAHPLTVLGELVAPGHGAIIA